MRRELPILIFTALYVAAATIGALSSGNSEFVFYIVVMLVLGTVVWIVHRRVELHTMTLWGLSLWGLAHMMGGLLPVRGDVLYNLWLIPERLKYDQLVHGLGFALCTWLCWQGLARALPGARPTLGLLVLAALASMGLGAFNEVVEFAATRLMSETNVGGYVNTGWDLVANTIGAVIAAVWIRLAHREPGAA